MDNLTEEERLYIVRRVDSMMAKMDKHIDDDMKLHASIIELNLILSNIKTAVNFLAILGTIFKWFASIAVGVAALYGLITFYRTGVPPTIRID